MVLKKENNYKFSNLKKIGEGEFENISKAIWIRQNHQLEITGAIKKLINDDIYKFKQKLKIIKKVCKNSKHQNIIKFYKTTTIQNYSFHMDFQFANKGNLQTYLKKLFEKLIWIQKLQMAYEISKG
ncbi:28607_t:CDS:2, partial [Gigaspora margarita]